MLRYFDVEPDYDLDIMVQNQSLFDISAKVLSRLRPVLEKERPALLLVQGDTTTTVMASLAAFYMKIPIGHIEAGLRTPDRHLPFPEEMNRRLCADLADFHFAPSEVGKQNLIQEGIDEERILVTGNTGVDALNEALAKQRTAGRQRALRSYFRQKFDLDIPAIGGVVNRTKKLLLATVHRRENAGDGLINICNALKKSQMGNPDVVTVFCVHLNENTSRPVRRILGGVQGVRIVDPLDYDAFLYLLKHAYMVLTDSGGVQEEASCLGKPTLVVRRFTERVETVSVGPVKVVGTEEDAIYREVQMLLQDEVAYRKTKNTAYYYGSGNAARKIVDFFINNKSVGSELNGLLPESLFGL
jgi:UDP-N-acetylglucosamine 2-epimerase (non-hydrolysing)